MRVSSAVGNSLLWRVCTLIIGAAVLLPPLMQARAQETNAPEPSNFLVASWHTEHGLPDGNITALAQTPDGYLWIGTFKGLARFDGARFVHFDARQTLPFLEDRIAALMVDRTGDLWVAGETGELGRFSNGKFQAIESLTGATNSAASAGSLEREPARVRSTHSRRLRAVGLVEDTSGTVWFQPDSASLFRVRNGLSQVELTTDGLLAGPFNALFGDGRREPWLLAGDWLYRRGTGDWVKQGEVKGLGALRAVLGPGRDGSVWIAAPRGSWQLGGGQVLRLFDGQVSEPFEPTPWETNSPRSGVTALLEDHTGRVWLGTQWGGVLSAIPGGHWEHPQSSGPLTQCRVNCLFEDRQGAVWVGTLGDGLHRLIPRPVRTVHLPEPAKEHLINSVSAAGDGSVWIGTDGAGLFRYGGNEFKHFGAAEGLGDSLVHSVLVDRNTNVWCGTASALYFRREGRFERVTGLPVPQAVALALFEDRAGRIWIGSHAGPISWQLRGAPGGAPENAGEFQLHRLDEHRSGFEIRSMAEDQAGNLWVGTVAEGLFCLRSNRVDRYRAAEGLANPDARSLCCDSRGVVWIGTLGGGLFRLANGKMQGLTTADGLPDDTINGILPDENDNLWMTSYNGIFGCPRETLARYRYERGRTPALLCRWFSLADGLDYRTCSGSGQPVLSRTDDGRFWFVNQRCVGVFDPRSTPVSEKVGDLILEEAIVDGTTRTIPASGPLQVSSQLRHLELHYTCPNLTAPGSLRFRYRLRGVDEDWVEAGAQRVAYYGHLAPGHYEFEAMVGAAGGNWRRWARGLELEVVPQFYERGWVQAGGGAGLLAAAALISWGSARRRLRRRLAALEQQQALEQERARIARDMHDEIGARLTQISLMSTLAMGSAEDATEVRTQNSRISDVTRDLTRSLDEIVWAVRPQNDNLESLVEYLGQAARDLCAGSSVRCWFSAPPVVPSLEVAANVRHNVLLASCEAINNVVKHSGASEVRVRVLLEPSQMSVEVSDNGHGFDLAAGEAKCSGLLHMRQRMTEIGGACQISTREGATRIQFTLPLAIPGENGTA
jgi:signal transduction histidine kinase/ligand-binding sensor domain-containing protein